jgi:serine phosphatase RsbU (regulator of sigma subunit)
MIVKTLQQQSRTRAMSAQTVMSRPSKRNTATATNRPTSRAKSASAVDTGLAQQLLALQQELDSVRAEHSKLQQAIYEAAQIQRKQCAPREMQWGDFEIAGESFAVRHLTGDFFKVLELDNALGVALGDIAGKGLTAGIWQAHLLDLVKRYARTNPHPAQVLASVNRDLCADSGEPPMTALFYARIENGSNSLVYCNAGLPAPLLLRGDKSVDRLEAGGPMLGAVADGIYSAGTVTMNSGDLLLAYSDGLTECRNAQDEEFEIHRLIATAKANAQANANQVLFSTLAAVLDFAEGCPSNDDMTLLVARCRGSVAETLPAVAKGKAASNSVARRRSKTATRTKQAVN